MDVLRGTDSDLFTCRSLASGDRSRSTELEAGLPTLLPAPTWCSCNSPEDCIRDATGVWLKDYVVDGIRYILSFADPNKTKNVVINLSYGPTTGPHDGTAELEAALTALVAEFDGTNGKPKLEIVLAAGNSYLSEGHVVFAGDTTSRPRRMDLAPSSRQYRAVLCRGMDEDRCHGVKVTLTSPSGEVVTTTPPTAAHRRSGGRPVAWGNNTMWRLQVGPTIAAPAIVAEHGDWTIKVAGIRKGAEVHAYVARTDPNMGVRTGAKRSYFVDPNWERTHSAEASCTYADGEFDKTGSLVRRYGTLNGIATAKDASVHVAGGYIIANGRKSPYSSAGPARGGPLASVPTSRCPVTSPTLSRAYVPEATGAAAVFRLIGTSAAAPQLARHVRRSADPTRNQVFRP